VNGDKEVWCCNHCGWSGSLKQGQYSNSQFKREYRKIEYKKTDLPEKVLTWFKSRGISEKTLIKNEVGYDRVYMPQEEDFVNAIKFPYRKNGEIVNVKYRDGKRTSGLRVAQKGYSTNRMRWKVEMK